jgi:uncharacterized protein YecE (DUF72 family)
MACDIRIGTSGWHYKHWRGPFYPQKWPADRMLSFYVQHFDSVELNNSFYHLPRQSSLEQWRDRTPEDFCFAVKASRYLTHMRKLAQPEAGLDRFLPLIETLGDKQGPILFQLPPHWSCNPDRLAHFLTVLPPSNRYAFELRDPSWHVPEVYRLLERHNVAFCIYQLAGFVSPLLVTADFAYVRLHGPQKKKYRGSYSAQALRKWTQHIRGWESSLKAVYVYFDNDQAGYAALNALALRRRLQGESPRRSRRVSSDRALKAS